jgi:hypothetical protein
MSDETVTIQPIDVGHIQTDTYGRLQTAKIECPDCGQGISSESDCMLCRGAGEVDLLETVRVLYKAISRLIFMQNELTEKQEAFFNKMRGL